MKFKVFLDYMTSYARLKLIIRKN